MTAKPFSDYLVFIDESGSPSMGRIDPDFPLLVLAFMIVRKDEYLQQVVPAVQGFKFQHFGHDQVILHERDIRRDLGPFAFLRTRALKQAFLDELTAKLADLMARPMGMSVLKPDQPNRAVDVIKRKLVQVNGRAAGWGSKVFP